MIIGCSLQFEVHINEYISMYTLSVPDEKYCKALREIKMKKGWFLHHMAQILFFNMDLRKQCI